VEDCVTTQTEEQIDTKDNKEEFDQVAVLTSLESLMNHQRQWYSQWYNELNDNYPPLKKKENTNGQIRC